MPVAAGIWHGKVYGAMLLMEAAKGLMYSDAMKMGRTSE